MALCLAAGLCIAAAGCSGVETTPADPVERRGIPAGPGLLTGETGEFTILSK